MNKEEEEKFDQRQEREWQTYLQGFLKGVSYSLAAPTIVSISFCDDHDAEKIWHMDSIMRDVYGAYSTGPILMHVPERPNLISFGFRHLEELDLARRDLRLPDELQAGPPIYL